MEITRRYLQLRSAFTLAILIVAGLSAFLISSYSQQVSVKDSENTRVLGRVMVTTAEMALAFQQLSDGRERVLREDNATGVLRRNARLGQVSLEEFTRRREAGLFSADSTTLLNQTSLNPISQFEKILTLAAIVSAPESPKPRRFKASEIGLEISERLFPVLVRLGELEAEALQTNASSQETYTLLAMAIGALGIVVAYKFVHVPMERFIISAHERIQNGQKAAETASEAKSSFLATMSHEIRTPLNGVLGLSEVLLEGENDPERKRMQALVVKSGNSLLQIINDVLDLSKIEAGKMDLDTETFDAKALCADVLELFSAQAHRKGVKTSLVVANEEASLTYEGHGKTTRQILLNLVNNAIKFTEQGEITVSILDAPPHPDTGKPQFRMIVQDSGIGISAEAQKRIFDQFSQADGSTTTRFGGTGLGLAIVKKLTTLMGGTVAVESEVDFGSTFTVTIPMERRLPKRLVATTESSAAKFTGKVLVVDDNKVNRLVAEKILTRLGLDVESAEDGLFAIEKFKTSAPDLVLMDVRMPNMDGLEATAEIRALERKSQALEIPIIGLSANAMSEHYLQGLQAGMTAYLSKPLKKPELLEVLSRHMPATYPDSQEGNSQCA